MRCEGEPRLKNQCEYTGPVEQKTRCEVFFHVMPVNVVHDEGKGMEKSEDEEGVRYPAMENLKPLM